MVDLEEREDREERREGRIADFGLLLIPVILIVTFLTGCFWAKGL